MGGRKLLVLGLLALSIAPAWGQSDEDYAKYARPVIDEFTACEKPKLEVMARSSRPAEEIVGQAISECQDHLNELKDVMRRDPFGLNEPDAAAAIQEMLDGMRPLMLDTVKKARG